MSPALSNPKIEELRFRLKTDPKSRLFFPLAEELRKAGGQEEAEQVLNTGLANHPTYLSAWVSLGRILREQGKSREAVGALTRALQLDGGNVVAARLLADAYMDLGEKVEAIKKYKLVHALLPSDQDLEAMILQLDRELNPPPEEPALDAAPPVSPFSSEEPVQEIAVPFQRTVETPYPPGPSPVLSSAPEEVFEARGTTSSDDSPFEADSGLPGEPLPATVTEESPFADSTSPWHEAERSSASEVESTEDADTKDSEPMHAAHAESPFEDPGTDGYGSDAFALEQPEGMHATDDPAPVEARSHWDMEADALLAGGDQPALSVDDRATLESSPDEAEVFAPETVEDAPFDDTAPAGEIAGHFTVPSVETETEAENEVERGGERLFTSTEESPFDDVPTAAPKMEPASWATPSSSVAAIEVDAEDEAGPFQTSVEESAEQDDATDTLTMADLYARQGLTDEARQIYEHILHRDPANRAVQEKLAGLSAVASNQESNRKISKLEQWLSRVGRRGEHLV